MHCAYETSFTQDQFRVILSRQLRAVFAGCTLILLSKGVNIPALVHLLGMQGYRPPPGHCSRAIFCEQRLLIWLRLQVAKLTGAWDLLYRSLEQLAWERSQPRQSVIALAIRFPGTALHSTVRLRCGCGFRKVSTDQSHVKQLLGTVTCIASSSSTVRAWAATRATWYGGPCPRSRHEPSPRVNARRSTREKKRKSPEILHAMTGCAADHSTRTLPRRVRTYPPLYTGWSRTAPDLT
jgi:hypothetical protein